MARYNQLVKIITNSLSQSSKHIDKRLAVQKCYGEDISMFATGEDGTVDNGHNSNDDGIDMLANLINDILEKINDAFLQNENNESGLRQILSKEKVQLRLDILDQVIEEFISKQKFKEEKEQNDIKSAKDAIKNTNFLPPGIEMRHIMTYQSYRMKLELRKDLLAEVEKAEKEKELLLKNIETEKRDIMSFVTETEKEIVDPLNKNADICSFNGIS